ncbi:probable LRR receptor-like serine/threonine-protein kinase At3g47570 [Arachis ipaensis]|uniref:probable LRR receptor-like serine/threonine-protein kinase At3g47570 n=1 Tax=Arachis ipaensis TaxID=130454 RepID=UPI0007AFA27F|nr:probable LRR receptor-like serine/threonine-protein kinase At3g47570 [Arachis ipaensis]XP_025637201.1 probable LRR receptor-like serine/threonine-protein kinase At3g47570 [Arachis hypogaea]
MINKLRSTIRGPYTLVGRIPPSLGNLSSLETLSLAYNHLEGNIPHVLGVNSFRGQIPLTLRIGLNKFQQLIMDYNNLGSGQNSLQGSIPDSVGKLENLARLNLQQNKLSSNIPSVIGNLIMLSEVYRGINKLEGSLPFTLRYCTMMQKFVVDTSYLSGNIPNNTFGYQKGLITLDLSINVLTGFVPLDFGNLKQLSILYLHTNNLFGEVSLELSACYALTDFWLTRNFFHGSILSFLGSLRNLEILDFSINNFSNTIGGPLFELENLTFLNYLNFCFNHLYGEVPIGGIFRNITEISLIGNEDFCGGIPQLNLPPSSELLSHKHKSSFKVTVIIVISGVSASFVVFICICYLRKKPKILFSSPSLEHRYLKVSYGELHQATDGFSTSNLVDTRSFGSVYKGTLLVQFERRIAVKVLNLQPLLLNGTYLSSN